MIAWKKFLSSGRIEVATEDSLALGESSWTKGQRNIVGAEIWLNGKAVRIEANGLIEELEQYDHCIVSAGNPKPVVIARSLVLPNPEGRYSSALVAVEQRKDLTVFSVEKAHEREVVVDKIVFQLDCHGTVTVSGDKA